MIHLIITQEVSSHPCRYSPKDRGWGPAASEGLWDGHAEGGCHIPQLRRPSSDPACPPATGPSHASSSPTPLSTWALAGALGGQEAPSPHLPRGWGEGSPVPLHNILFQHFQSMPTGHPRCHPQVSPQAEPRAPDRSPRCSLPGRTRARPARLPWRTKSI